MLFLIRPKNKLYFLSKRYLSSVCLHEYSYLNKNDYNYDIGILKDDNPMTSISILGYSDRLRAFSLNLYDNNINVIIGLNENDKDNIVKAKSDGWKLNKNILDINQAINCSDIIHFSDNIYNQISILKSYYFGKKKTIYFSNQNTISLSNLGINSIYKDLDIFILDPTCSSSIMRNNFINKKEIEAHLSIVKDSSGYTLDTALYIADLVGINKLI